MSTNFYVMGYQGNMDPDFHVGKRVGIENGKTAFKWAMTSARFGEVTSKYSGECPTCGQKINKSFVDEYGHEYNVIEFYNMLSLCHDEIYESVGQLFL